MSERTMKEQTELSLGSAAGKSGDGSAPVDAIRLAWEAGFKLAVGYGDNWPHFDGEQKERQWLEFLASAPKPSPCLEPSGTTGPAEAPLSARWQELFWALPPGAKTLSKGKRGEIARKAAAARWKGHKPKKKESR
jgi:hypothetical protein